MGNVINSQFHGPTYYTFDSADVGFRGNTFHSGTVFRTKADFVNKSFNGRNSFQPGARMSFSGELTSNRNLQPIENITYEVDWLRVNADVTFFVLPDV